MQFILVNGRSPRAQPVCTLCSKLIGEDYLREIATRLSYCSHECYVDHCTNAVLALENQAWAS